MADLYVRLFLHHLRGRWIGRGWWEARKLGKRLTDSKDRLGLTWNSGYRANERELRSIQATEISITQLEKSLGQGSGWRIISVPSQEKKRKGVGHERVHLGHQWIHPEACYRGWVGEGV